MDICENCGRLFLTANHALWFCHLEDQYGTWHEWLCDQCCDDAAQQAYEGNRLVAFHTWGFDMPQTG